MKKESKKTKNPIKKVKRTKKDSTLKPIIVGEKSSEEYWKIATITLGILLIISVYFNINQTQSKILKTSSTSISLETASQKAVEIINNNLLPPGVKAKIIDKKEENGLYKITLRIDNQEVESYISNDGKLLFPNAINLENPPKEEAPAKVQTSPQTSNVVEEISIDDDTIRGDLNAPITIVEFSDFECPFCGRYYSQTYSKIIEEYVNSGKVRYVFRDFPLSFHQNAQKAAEAAECADDQGKFWEMHDKLFENQRALSIDNLKQYAKDIGLDSTVFDNCLDSNKYREEVQKDVQDGSSYGITGTPSFFINGKKLVGAQPFEAFKSIIDAELIK